jgi:hypothetical protein
MSGTTAVEAEEKAEDLKEGSEERGGESGEPAARRGSCSLGCTVEGGCGCMTAETRKNVIVWLRRT